MIGTGIEPSDGDENINVVSVLFRLFAVSKLFNIFKLKSTCNHPLYQRH